MTLAYFLLTFFVSWVCFEAGGPLVFLGVVSPSLVALALTARGEGWRGVAELLRRTVRGPERPSLYALAVGYMAAIKLAVAALHRLVTGAWPPFGETPWYVMLGATLVSTPVQAGEEIGWRGYALPRLASRLGLGGASLVLGVAWAAWHLPFFSMPGSTTFGQSFPVYLLQVVALSVAMAWLYWRGGGSLLLVMLMHAAVNNTKDVVPSAVAGADNPFTLGASLVAWLSAALLWAGAAWFLLRMRGARLDPAPAR